MTTPLTHQRCALERTHENNAGGSLCPALGSVVIVIEVMQGRNLVAKDRSFITGRRTTSDPYVVVYSKLLHGPRSIVGQTEAVKKSLNPNWSAKIDLELDGDDHVLLQGVDLEFEVWDYDKRSEPDFMGAAVIHLDVLDTRAAMRWVPLQKSGLDPTKVCKNASGDLQLRFSVSGINVPALVPGNLWNVRFADCSQIGFSWDSSETEIEVQIAAFDPKTQRLNLDHSIFGQKVMSPSIKCMRGPQDGWAKTKGYNILLQTSPQQKWIYVVIVAIPHSSNGKGGIRARFLGSKASPMCVAEMRSQQHPNGTTSIAMFRMEYVSEDLVINVINDCFTGPVDIGGLPLHVYCSDKITVDPDYFALLQTNSCFWLNDYVEGTADKFAFGASWDTIPGAGDVDFDLSAILMDKDFGELEVVSFRQLLSRDKSIFHTGDSRVDNNPDLHVDESIELNLKTISEDVAYIGFYVTPHTVEPQVATFSCQIGAIIGGRDNLVGMFLRDGSLTLQNGESLILACLKHEGLHWLCKILNGTGQINAGDSTLDDFFTSQNNIMHSPCSHEDVTNVLPPYKDTMKIEQKVMIPGHEFKRMSK